MGSQACPGHRATSWPPMARTKDSYDGGSRHVSCELWLFHKSCRWAWPRQHIKQVILPLEPLATTQLVDMDPLSRPFAGLAPSRKFTPHVSIFPVTVTSEARARARHVVVVKRQVAIAVVASGHLPPNQGEEKRFAYFKCEDCNRKWMSVRVHSLANCGQDCKMCGTTTYPYKQEHLKSTYCIYLVTSKEAKGRNTQAACPWPSIRQHCRERAYACILGMMPFGPVSCNTCAVACMQRAPAMASHDGPDEATRGGAVREVPAAGLQLPATSP